MPALVAWHSRLLILHDVIVSLLCDYIDKQGEVYPMDRALEMRERLEQQVLVGAGDVELEGDLVIPAAAQSLIVFVHGSGSSRHSPRNKLVARFLNEAGLGTLLFDLLTEREEAQDVYTAKWRFDIGHLAGRVIAATEWLAQDKRTEGLKIGYFGASTGAAAALVAAARLPELVGAVVSRGGRADLAESNLAIVKAPTLLIVGGNDTQVLPLNNEALELLNCEKELSIVVGATHLFEEPGKLEQVAELTGDWFRKHLPVHRAN